MLALHPFGLHSGMLFTAAATDPSIPGVPTTTTVASALIAHEAIAKPNDRADRRDC